MREKYAVLFFTIGEGYTLDIKENQSLDEVIRGEKKYVAECGLKDNDILHILKVKSDGSTELIYDIRYGFIEHFAI